MEQRERRARREFSEEFKTRTVELILSSGKSINEVCRELDLTETAVRRWVKQARIDQGESSGLTSDERAELARRSMPTSGRSWAGCGARSTCSRRSGRS